MTHFEIIVAADERDGIGKLGELPWRIPGDMAHFRKLTTQTPSKETRNAVIMGRKTWDSIPLIYRPLKRRLNVVVTHNPQLEVDPGVLVTHSLSDALGETAKASDIDRIFLIGGGTLYREGVPMPECRRIHLTRVMSTFDCDTFFPKLDAAYELASRSEPREENERQFRFEVYERID